jgi:hypothetical protein
MLDLAKGRNRARCSCGWYFPEPIEGDPNEIEAVPPRWAKYAIEEVLEAAQTHRLENDEEPWVCSLSDELGAFTEDWLRSNLISRGAIRIDHEHTEDSELEGMVEILIQIPTLPEAEEFQELDEGEVENPLR